MTDRLERLEEWHRKDALESGMDAMRACMRQVTLAELRAWVAAELLRLRGEALTEGQRKALARGRGAFSDPGLTAAVHRLAGGSDTDAVSGTARRLMLAAIKEHAWRHDWGSR